MTKRPLQGQKLTLSRCVPENTVPMSLPGGFGYSPVSEESARLEVAEESGHLAFDCVSREMPVEVIPTYGDFALNDWFGDEALRAGVDIDEVPKESGGECPVVEMEADAAFAHNVQQKMQTL